MRRSALSLLLCGLVVLAGCSAITERRAASPDVPAPGEGRVVTVVDVADGDTVDVRYRNGTRETVRLLGVDTPEVWVANDPAEFPGVPDTAAGADCLRAWGHRASEYTRERLAGREVRIVVGGDGRGAYGRLLAYVYVNGTNHNYRLVEAGYARVYESSFSQLDRFRDAQERAREADRGLWRCGTTADEAATPAASTAGTGTSGLAVVRVHADAAGEESANLNDEYVVLANRGNAAIDLSGWTLADAAGHRYRFPDGTRLEPGERLAVHTGAGTNVPGHRYWDAGRPVWNNGGDTVIVTTRDGTTAVRYVYGR